jgi:hypothetical protein
MKGHRNAKRILNIFDERRHPFCEERCAVGAVRMLKFKDQILTVRSIYEYRSGRLIDGTVMGTSPAKSILINLKIKGQATAATIRRGDERDKRPAGCAEPWLVIQNDATFYAPQRDDKINKSLKEGRGGWHGGMRTPMYCVARK